ncbi:MAG: fibronectin type III-like domain-contianing protein [Bacteroidales bacterium]|nr:fibronectin type III-like domain-contianing protein [Bacteroidales bacterium]
MKAFKKIELDAGDSTTVKFKITKADLSFYDEFTDK